MSLGVVVEAVRGGGGGGGGGRMNCGILALCDYLMFFFRGVK